MSDNCLLKHIIEGKIEGKIIVTRRRGGRYKHLLCDFKKKTGYWKKKEEALDRNLWRTRIGKFCGNVVRQPRLSMNACMYRVIHKSLRNFRTRLRNNQDRHGRKEHINK